MSAKRWSFHATAAPAGACAPGFGADIAQGATFDPVVRVTRRAGKGTHSPSRVEGVCHGVNQLPRAQTLPESALGVDFDENATGSQSDRAGC
ncbi:MAG: hypothetical protein JSR18_09370 [Proteobacteria bacterium]|nr:hypothetical protein [Pseudomonadota bacterium]